MLVLSQWVVFSVPWDWGQGALELGKLETKQEVCGGGGLFQLIIYLDFQNLVLGKFSVRVGKISRKFGLGPPQKKKQQKKHHCTVSAVSMCVIICILLVNNYII